MDTFIRGLIAGFLAGILKDIPDALIHVFRIRKLGFWDYAGAVGLNRLPSTWIEHLLAFGLEVIFSTGLGAIFVFLAERIIKTRHYLLLGAFFGGSVWFLVTGLIKIFDLKDLQTYTLSEPIINLFLSMAYGLLLMGLDHWLKNWILDKRRPGDLIAD
jgi:hypothetical protein